jgi:hypothetical protein
MTKIILCLLIGAGIGFTIAALYEDEKRNGGGRFGW